PYLRVSDAKAAIEFYKLAFNAEEDFRLCEPGGRVGHAELKFGSFTIMLSDEYPEYGIHGPEKFGGSGSSVHLHVEDVDAMTKQAEAAGAKVTMPPTDMFYGERSSKLLDPFGHEWMLGSHIEEISAEEMQRRFNEIMGQSAQE
ncbi:MAG: VOC family protein, partial [Leptolyngbyaceae bacterium]|nr:VOC family protein [Leptolyngbyaceae bacterium]